MPRVDVHPRHPVALEAVLDRERMAAEDVDQRLGDLLVALRDVHPDDAVVPGEQLRQVRDLVPRHAVPGHQPYVHLPSVPR